MAMRPDIVVYSPDGEPRLIVEIKRHVGASEEWARTLRRNLLVHGVLPAAKYFLLALPDRFFLWKDGDDDPEAMPHFTASTQVLKPYLGDWKPEGLTDESLQLVIKSWLSDLAHGQLTPEEVPDHLQWILYSGLYDSIRDGRVDRPSAA